MIAYRTTQVEGRDRKSGDANGVGLTALGGGWFVLYSTGSQVPGTSSGGRRG
jgi:hypothetical protein